MLSLLQLRLNASQIEEKKSHEAAVKEIEEQIEAESDEKKKDLLRVELKARESKLDALMDRFVVRGVDILVHMGVLSWCMRDMVVHGESIMTSVLDVEYDIEKCKVWRSPSSVPNEGEKPPVAVINTAPPPPSGYSNRYNPTQQYAAGGYRGGHRGRSGYVPVQNAYGGRGGRGRSSQYVPDWAREEYMPANNQKGPPGAPDSEGAFYDYPLPQEHRGRGRGRGRGGGGREQSQHFYQGVLPGRGVGGEIEFDSFSGQDRY